MQIKPYSTDAIYKLISSKRLYSYQQIFNPKDKDELLGGYLWNLYVSSLFFKVSNLVEIGLRNAINNALTNDLGEVWWAKNKLRYKSYISSQHPIPESVKKLREGFVSARSQAKREKESRYGVMNYIPTHEEIISNTKYQIWELILDDEFVGNKLIWNRNLGKAFKGSWPNNSSNDLLTSLRQEIKNIRLFRNRIAHHEPLWKAHNINNIEDAIAYLNKKLSSMEKILNYISPDKIQFVEAKGLLQELRKALTVNSINYYMRNNEKTINVANINKIKYVLKQAKKQQTPVNFQYGTTLFILNN